MTFDNAVKDCKITRINKIPPPPKMYNTTIPWSQTLRHDHRNPHDPGNYTNDWLDQSAASYMLAGYSPQSFLIYFSDMGWRLASRAICPENVTVVLGSRHEREMSRMAAT
ncbi:hypothetical protein TNCV_868521 [Trichonephila clavipes]|nr:hypothetical protein TNCV_868521 [Trichonephila clavipes]